jgi:hypothetical protein
MPHSRRFVLVAILAALTISVSSQEPSSAVPSTAPVSNHAIRDSLSVETLRACWAYAAGGAAAGLLPGVLVTLILMSRMRRRQEGVEAENAALKAQLARAVPKAEEAPPASRWTGTEIAAILGALGTFLGTAGTIYSNVGSRTIDALKNDLQQMEAQKNASAQALADAYTILGFDPARWSTIKEGGLAQADIVDNLKIAGACSEKGKTVGYNGIAPAILKCKVGSVRIRVKQPTDILLTMSR